MPLTPHSARKRVARGAQPPKVQQAPDVRSKTSAKNDAIIERVRQHAPAPPPTGKTILALDPGGSTGIALRLPDGRFLTNTVQDPGDLWDFFIERPDFVVYEIFATGGRVDRYMIYTIELVGGIKAVCYALGIRSFAHPPQRRYPWMRQSEALLAQQGTPHTRHEIDAFAHLLGFEELHPECFTA